MKFFWKRKKKVKPVKKGTSKRNFKAWLTHLDRRQQLRAAPAAYDMSTRVCPNCGEKYTGRYCPQCGQAGLWKRYTWRQTIMNFLDIWGLGNRPMFRTIKELFWRPGYMVRDYLNGNRQFYFPPFKLLAVTVILLMFTYWVTGQEHESLLSFANELPIDKLAFSPILEKMGVGLVKGLSFLASNPLYETLFFTILGVCCVRIAFINKGNYNFVETFIFMVFLNCLGNFLGMFSTLGSGINGVIENHLFASQVLSSSAFLSSMAALYSFIASLVSSLFIIGCLLLLVAGFKQFYGLTWKSAVAGLIRVLGVAIFASSSVVVIVVVFTKLGYHWGFYSILVVALMVGIVYCVIRYLNDNKSVINSSVRIFCKFLMWTLLIALPLLVIDLAQDFVDKRSVVWYISIASILVAVVGVLVSISPALLYKKFHRTWISSLPLIVLILILIIYQSVSVE